MLNVQENTWFFSGIKQLFRVFIAEVLSHLMMKEKCGILLEKNPCGLMRTEFFLHLGPPCFLHSSYRPSPNFRPPSLSLLLLNHPVSFSLRVSRSPLHVNQDQSCQCANAPVGTRFLWIRGLGLSPPGVRIRTPRVLLDWPLSGGGRQLVFGFLLVPAGLRTWGIIVERRERRKTAVNMFNRLLTLACSLLLIGKTRLFSSMLMAN